MEGILNSIRHGDCIAGMNALPEGSVDLVFADPPFNIGYDYDVYDDSRECREYLEWSSKWIGAVHRVLKPDGTFWLAIGDEYAAELKVESQKLGFHCRNWVIWYYTFGVHCSHKFTRSHAHLFYFVKDPKKFTFNSHDVRVPSARELVYNDARANPAGRMPDDTWTIRPSDMVGEMIADDDENWSLSGIEPPSDNDRTFILRPQDADGSFQPSEDTWYYPRVAGTFKERSGFHGCQMPEQLLGRIIRASSNPGDLVLDPFSGSATTLAVAKKLGRAFIGFDLSEQYVEFGTKRVDAIQVGDPLDGSKEPRKSAPKTGAKGNDKSRAAAAKKGRQPKAKAKRATGKNVTVDVAPQERQAGAFTARGVIEAFQRTHDGFSADRVVADPAINRRFVEACEQFGLAGDASAWNTLLFRLRKVGKLAHLQTVRQTTRSWDECDNFIFASEIALQQMIEANVAHSLDEILCNPKLAAEFDRLAAGLAPGFQPLDYRWAALRLRKEAKKARDRAIGLEPPDQLGDRIDVRELCPEKLPDEPGLYLVGDAQRKFYVGETLSLRNRLGLQFGESQLEMWNAYSSELSVEWMPKKHTDAGRLAWQSCLVKRHNTSLNYFELCSVS